VIGYGLLIFGWLLWGSKSIKLIYLPSLIGSFIILPFVDIKASLILTLPLGGLFIGWATIFFISIFFNYEYLEKSKERSKNGLIQKDLSIPGKIHKKEIKNKEFVENKYNNLLKEDLSSNFAMDDFSIQNEYEERMEQKRLSKEIIELVLQDELRELRKKKMKS